METSIVRRPSMNSNVSHSTSALSNVLKARRKSKPNNSSTPSIASSGTAGDASSGMRSSLDEAMEKLKTSSEEHDGGEPNGTREKMAKLFKSRRRRRKSNAQDDVSQADLTEDIPIPPLQDTGVLSLERSAYSDESLRLHPSVGSSLLTEDSDADSPPIRPSLSPHQSHMGYLTTSSPLISSQTVESSTSLCTTTDTSPNEDTLAPRHAKTLGAPSEQKRSPSPVGKLKEAFAPTRRATSPKIVGDNESAKSGSSGGLGSLFGGVGKKGGSSSRRGSSVLEEHPLIHTSLETQSAPVLPSVSPKKPENLITSIPATPPNLAEAPTTLVTPPTPTDGKPPSPTGSNRSLKTGAKPVSHQASASNPNIVTSPSGNMISHRRVRSATNPPSKLSNSISAPLTPTLEETKTPGGSLSSPQNNSGFFSSVFSAAQNAATQLTTTIANTSITTGTKNKSGLSSQLEEEKTGDVGGEEVIGPEPGEATTENRDNEPRQLAVETLGSGNLSLAQLGISESSDISPMSSKTNILEQSLPNDHASAKAEDIAAAQAVSAAYASEKPNGVARPERPRSLTTLSGGAGTSPPRLPDTVDSPGSIVQRTGSIRSRISGGRKRRHRGSSATTGHTIAAAIGASTTTLAHPGALANAQRLQGTGFAVAPAKRNRDFHNLFRSVPEDDYLIEDYSAALQRDILLHGRLYVSEGHICFSSNILGWVTNLVISFDEIVTVEKKSTAVIFPNAIVIQTLHARNVFPSFVSRDSTYDLIIGIWKISHPNLKSSVNGVTLDGNGTGDKTEKDESVGSDDGSIDGSDDEVYDEDAEDEGLGSFTEAGEGSVAGSEDDSIQGAARKASAAALGAPMSGGTNKIIDNAEAAITGASATQDFPGVPTHGATECGDGDSHYDKLLIDTTIPAPLGKIYSLMFGPMSGQFMRKWLIENQKSTELQMEDDKKGLGEESKSQNISYIKPLGGGLGPKQTKCIVAMTLEQYDLEKAVTVLCSTQTPDVPSGNIFLTKTRYCLMWGPGNSTRLIMTFTVEWSGKSWLKGPIEKGANDGQLSYAKDIAAALRAAVTTKAAINGAPRGRGKGRKRRADVSIDDGAAVIIGDDGSVEKVAAHKAASWGVLEPLHGPLGPVVEIIGSFVSGPTVIAVLVALLLFSWLRRPSTVGVGSLGVPGLATPQRIAAYEEMWRKEESELWRWLEERVVIDRVLTPPVEGEAWRKKQWVGGMQQKLVEENMSERQVDEAIRVTQERLETLKKAVERRKGK